MSYQKHLAGEANLARRITREREAKGWSARELARRVEAAGCTIPPNAIPRIESGQRGVSVDELLGLAEAFDLDVSDLLTPVELLDQLKAERIADDVRTAMDALYGDARGLLAALTDLRELQTEAPEAAEYLLNLLAAPFWAAGKSRGQHPTEGEQRTPALAAIDEATGDLISAAWDALYLDADRQFGHYLAVEGSGVVPDPAQPMRTKPRGN